MAKRKRLSPALIGHSDSELPALETKSALPPATRAPIAQVAGEASAAAALQDLADEVGRARDAGLLIQKLPLDSVDAGYLVRDRMAADTDDMQVLIDSIRARGQQTPIEVVDQGDGRFGLISGWRRLGALRQLHGESGDEAFATVQAILRKPASSAEAYVAMVEENEIRADLSHYERARVAAIAVEQGVYETEKKALLALFANASRAKRSKIRAFLPIYHALDPVLRFAPAIPERLGTALGRALDRDPGLTARLTAALERAAPETAEAELECLEAGLVPKDSEQSLNPGSETEKTSATATVNDSARESDVQREEVIPGLFAVRKGRGDKASLTLSGPALTDSLRDTLLDLIRGR